jgi:hypothetical protein
MSKRLFSFLACLLCLVLTSSVLVAQVAVPIRGSGKVIRLYQQGLPSDLDVDKFIQNGEIIFQDGNNGLPADVEPGPAPDPYPHVHMWELGMEQLGVSAEVCDGIDFTNGRLWHPNKWAIVRWYIRIPNASARSASEFSEDLTLSLWVDWNQDRMWGKNENVMREALNLQEYFPTSAPYLEIQYLSFFRIPTASFFEELNNGNELMTAKLWVRGIVSYDDPDTSPDGECLFGEVEDYMVSYFEVEKKIRKQD